MKTETDRSALASQEPGTGSGKKRSSNPIVRFLGEMPGLIIMSLILAILIKTFLIQAFYIPSGSMEDTLKINDRVLVTKVPYYFHDPQRGDVIVFSQPDPAKQVHRGAIDGFFHWLVQGIGIQPPDNQDFIKRVIGVPGDTVWAEHDKVYVNGKVLNEPYVKGSTTNFDKVKVPPDMYFVLGDNREQSEDSRFGLGVIADPKTNPGVGFIPRENIIGKAWVIVWPKSHWSTL